MSAVAIVGRPNVGKSTLFNRILGRRQSIVHPTPGLTRDRIEAETSWEDRIRFTLIDTGGIEGDPDQKGLDTIERGIRNQARVAAETADVILFMVDGRQGLTAADEAIASMIRGRAGSVVLVVNKVDPPADPDTVISEFHSLGMENIIAISAEHGRGIMDLMELVEGLLGDQADSPEAQEEIRVAVVGRPNAGKSSLVNRLLNEERLIVSDIPGTTRDAVDALVERDGLRFRFIDTAGIRKKARVEGIEYYSVNRAIKAIERSDVAVLMIDSSEGFSDQDVKIAAVAEKAGTALLVLLNKWDLVEKDDRTFDETVKEVRYRLGRMEHAPVLSISAKTGQRLDRLFGEISAAAERRRLRLTTSQINRMLREIVSQAAMPSKAGKPLKVYYMTQKETAPPCFVLFVNDRRILTSAFLNYLENQLRERADLAGIPVRLHARQSE